MKVFILQPNDIQYPHKLEERDNITKLLKEKYPNEDIKFIEPEYIKGAKIKANPLWLKGQALQLLSTCDIAVFTTHGDDEDRMEVLACKKYKIPHFYYIGHLFEEKMLVEGK